MKKIYLAFALLFCLVNGYAQQNFKPVKFDDVITVSFPGDVVELDTIVDNVRAYQLFTNSGNETFMMQKISLKDVFSGGVGAPDDKESLMKSYQKVAQGYVDGIDRSYKILNSSEIEMEGKTGIKVRLKAAKIIVAQIRIFYLADDAYIALYHNAVDYNKKNAEEFFNSMKVTAKDASQYTSVGKENQTAYKVGQALGYILFVGLLVGVIWLVVYVARKMIKK